MLTAIVSLLSCSGVLALLLVMDRSAQPGSVWDLAAAGRRHLNGLSSSLRQSVPASARPDLSGERQSAGEAWPECASPKPGRDRPRHSRTLATSRADIADARLRSLQLLSLYFPFLQLLSVVGKAATLAIGAGQIARGELSAGVLIAFLLYLDQFFTPLQQLSMVFDQGIQARVSLTRIRDLLETPTLCTPELAEPASGRVRGALGFVDVRFAYSRPLLPKRCAVSSLEIAPGRSSRSWARPARASPTFVKLAARFLRRDIGHRVIHRRRGSWQLCRFARVPRTTRLCASGSLSLFRHHPLEYRLRPPWKPRIMKWNSRRVPWALTPAHRHASERLFDATQLDRALAVCWAAPTAFVLGAGGTGGSGTLDPR